MRDLIPEYEVAVIGGGPAGCAAAITAARQGLSVIIIGGEERTSKKDRPCESVHPGIATLLTQLHASGALDRASTGAFEGIETNGIVAPFGFDAMGQWLGHHLDRTIFDKSLLAAAKDKGISVLTGETAKTLLTTEGWVYGLITTGEKEIISKYVIDASGYRRFAGRQLRFKERYYSPPLVAWTGVSLVTDATDPLLSGNYARLIPEPNGWTWLATGKDGRYNWTRLSIKGEKNFEPPRLLSNYPVITAIRTANMRWRIYRPLCQEGVLLCGDAAGILDPASGQGLLQALYSGIMAGQTVVDCLRNIDEESLILARYDNWFLTQFEKKAGMLKTHYAEQRIKIF